LKEPISRLFGGKWSESEQTERITEIPVNLIDPSPYQPRTVFEDDKLDELCQTIKTHGIIQPIVVRQKANRFELIAGERRLRAVKLLDLQVIPAIIRDMNDTQAASVALIENLQREGLTSIEEAIAYKRLIDIHSLTQEALAQRLGKSQSTIANKLRLLQLPEDVQTGLMQRKITERHARALLSLNNNIDMLINLYNDIIKKDLTVKQVEDKIAQLTHDKVVAKPKRFGISKDIRIARNTISQSINMVKNTGMCVEVDEDMVGDYYQITIKIKK